jgi:hypothetical protein
MVIRLRDFLYADTKGRWTVKVPGIVFRAPDISSGVGKFDWRVFDQGRGRVTFVERGKIDKRLERGARLALGLRRPVELAFIELPAALHRQHAPVVRVQRDNRSLHQRNLP